MLTSTPIALRNPFSILEFQDQKYPAPSSSTNETNAAYNHVVDRDEDLDLSSWSVVNSACVSDEEEEDDEDNGDEEDTSGDSDEIYADDSITTNNLSATVSSLPLHLSSLESGFTNISRAATARSINSQTVMAPENRGNWVLKVGKRKHCYRKTITTTTIPEEGEGFLSAPPSLASDQSEEDEEEEDEAADDGQTTYYMPMTERELFKSARAARIKNGRIALDHDRSLVRSLNVMGCFCSNNYGNPNYAGMQSPSTTTTLKRDTAMVKTTTRTSIDEDDATTKAAITKHQKAAQNPKKILLKMRAPRSKSKGKNFKTAKSHTLDI
ncbi:hypothetical protein BG004_001603 [Podila humilis]|nr:hypothetical protein BG004_001603 [Podila humilis]